ncbi:MAG: PorT family protein [Bacteroidetes bacterium]|nr:MAG: PorT family protein [Bacteroidota bacterium]
MKNLIFMIAMLPVFGIAQKYSSNQKLSVYLTPEINGLMISSSDLTQGYDLSSKSKSGFSLGIDMERKLADKLSLRTGLGYGYKRCFHEIGNWETLYDPKVGVLDAIQQTDFELHEVQVPISVKYDLFDRWYVSAGIETNYIFYNSSNEITIASDGHRENFKSHLDVRVNIAPMISLGYYIPKIKLSVEPQFNYYLFRNLTFQSNFYRFGMKMSYHF